MRRDPTTKPKDLQRPEGNGLKANYDKHDVGEAEFIERCDDLGFIVEEWGIDKRHDSGEAGVIFDDAMDFKVYVRCGEAQAEAWLADSATIYDAKAAAKRNAESDVEPLRLAALVDVKTKSNPRYMGRFNLRHHDNYAEHAEEYGVPTFVVMFQVDYREDEVYDEFAYRVEPGESAADSRRVKASTDSHAVDPFPDGNHAVLVKHRYREDWEYLVGRLAFQKDVGLK